MSTSETTLIAEDRRRVLSMLVEDHPGVLSRVSGMIRRRGFNVHGLSVGPIDRQGRSRMTLSVDAGHAEVDQIGKQLDRLIEVIAIDDLTDLPSFNHELALIKVSCQSDTEATAQARLKDAGCKVLYSSQREVIGEFAGEFGRVEDIADGLADLGAVEVARSGPVAMAKGV